MVRYQPSGQEPTVLEEIKKKPSRLSKILKSLKKDTGKSLVSALGDIADSDKKKKRKKPVKQKINERKSKGKSPEKIQELLRFMTSKKTATMHTYRDDANPDADTYIAYHIADDLGYVHTGWSDPYLQAHQILYSLYHANDGKPEEKRSKRHKRRKADLQKKIKALFQDMDQEQKDIAVYKAQQIKLYYAQKNNQTDKVDAIKAKQKGLKKQIIEKYENGEQIIQDNQITTIEFAKPGDPVKGLAFDTGGEGGVVVKNDNHKESFWGSSIVVDHHGETQMPPSATSMVREMIKEIGTTIPDDKSQLYTKVVNFMSGLDNMGYDIIAAKYRSSKASPDDLFSIAQDAPGLILEYFQSFPNVSGYKSFEEELGDQAAARLAKKVTVLGKEMTIQELVDSKKEKMTTAKEFVDDYVQKEHYVTINGKKFLLFLPDDGQLANTDFGYRVAGTIAAGYGVMNVFPGDPGDVYFYDEEMLDKKTFSMAHIMRDYIAIIQKTDPDYQSHIEELFGHIDQIQGVADKLASFWKMETKPSSVADSAMTDAADQADHQSDQIEDQVGTRPSASIEQIREKLGTKNRWESTVDFFRGIWKRLFG